MENRLRAGKSISSFFCTALFLLFVFCMMFVMITGANAYRNIVDRGEQSFYGRTGVSYIANKVRQFDMKDTVSIKNMNGRQILELRQALGDKSYHTLIYWMDGEIKELYKAVDDELPLDAGIGVVKAEGVEFRMVKDDLMEILVEGSDNIQSLFVYIRSGISYE